MYDNSLSFVLPLLTVFLLIAFSMITEDLLYSFGLDNLDTKFKFLLVIIEVLLFFWLSFKFNRLIGRFKSKR